MILIARKWQDRADRIVGEQLGITVKQWMLLSILEDEYRDHLPTLSEASESFGTSRQNTKRLAIELQKSGFLIIAVDPVDHRILRLALTGKHRAFFEEKKSEKLFSELSSDYFEILSDSEKEKLGESIGKIYFKLNV